MSGAVAESQQEAVVVEQHQKFLENSARPAFKAIHQAGIERFETLRFPHSKHEMYTFVNTREITGISFLPQSGTVDPAFVQQHILPGSAQSVLVFVDGIYDPGLSNTTALPGGVKLTPLEEALGRAEVEQALLQPLDQENDVFASLNAAFLNGGLLLEVADKVIVEAPVQFLFVGTGSSEAPVAHHPRLMIRLGATAEIKSILKFVGQDGGYLVNAGLDFVLADGASMTCSQFQNDHPSAWHLSKWRVSQARNSVFTAVNGSSGCRLARIHYDARLEDEGAEVTLKNASVLMNEDQSHHFVRIHHQAPHCNSHQHFKNVIGGRGRSSVDGTVIVNQGAQQTYSDQLLNNLMLSDEAHADNKPNLMIFADDVKCTHGATVGQINEDQLFYLKTRGLGDALSRQLLTTSFVESIIDEVPFPEVVEDMNRVLLGKLGACHA